MIFGHDSLDPHLSEVRWLKLSWQESAFTLDDAKAQVQRLGLSRPGEYLIFNHKTVGGVSIIVGPPKVERCDRDRSYVHTI
jgi:hypothetical protein